MPPKTKSFSVPEAMQARYAEITALTDACCLEKLNEEYAQVCREMAATLARKRPSPPHRRSGQKLGLRHRLHGRYGEFPVR